MIVYHEEISGIFCEKCKSSLIGVDKKERGNRIGSQLLTTGKSFFYDNDILEINVVTQKENVMACKFYEKNGFSIKKIQNVYRFWR